MEIAYTEAPFAILLQIMIKSCWYTSLFFMIYFWGSITKNKIGHLKTRKRLENRKLKIKE